MLTYQCGAGEESFESRKRACLSGGAIDGTLVTAANMDATFTAKEGNYLQWVRGNIHWTLTN